MTVSTTGTVAQTLVALANAVDYAKITPKARIVVDKSVSGRVYSLANYTNNIAEFINTLQGSPFDSVWDIYFSPNGLGSNGMSRKDTQSGAYADSSSNTASSHFGSSITLYY